MYYFHMPQATLSASVTHTAALSRLGHALSDPTRAGVLLALREAPAYPSDMADALGVSRQVMSNQLACLRGCGLVEAVELREVSGVAAKPCRMGDAPGTGSLTPTSHPP